MTLVWFVLILLCVLLYVVLDGYDLGIGIATLVERDAGRRRQLLELVSLTWDGNESWLVLTGVALWAGFPLAYGTILPHAFLPLMVMLFALIVRGVSVEMAAQRRPAPGWEKAFGIGSLVAALAQGVVASTLTAHLIVTGYAYNGSAFGAMSWYSALTALAVTAGYLAMGYAYVKWKTTGELRAEAGSRGFMATAAAVVLGAACLGAVNATAAPLNLAAPVRAGGFAWLIAVAVVGATMAAVTLRPASRYDALPMYGLAITVVATVLAVVVARYPVLVPASLTVYNAASPGSTFDFIAVGVGMNVPLVLFYSWYAHYAFRGRQASSTQASSTQASRAEPAESGIAQAQDAQPGGELAHDQ
jgi:cytochrome bd ubiquinol oxidase subunit II